MGPNNLTELFPALLNAVPALCHILQLGTFQLFLSVREVSAPKQRISKSISNTHSGVGDVATHLLLWLFLGCLRLRLLPDNNDRQNNSCQDDDHDDRDRDGGALAPLLLHAETAFGAGPPARARICAVQLAALGVLCPEVAAGDTSLSVGGELRSLWAGLGGEADEYVFCLEGPRTRF